MSVREIKKQIIEKLTKAGYPPSQYECEPHTHVADGGLRQSDDWDGGLETLSYAYRHAKPGDTVMIAVTSRGEDAELVDIVEFVIK